MTSDQEALGVGGRLREPPSSLLVQTAFQQEAAYGPWLQRGMNLADLAHVVMLIEQQIAPGAEGGALLQALLALQAAPDGPIAFNPALGDPYSNREAYLRQRVGQAAGWLGAGRARRESSTVAFALTVRDQLLEATLASSALLRALSLQAQAHVTTLLPDYTYLQVAQPTTLAHYLLTFTPPIVRDFERLRLAFEHLDECPAAIGSTNGSGLPLRRERVAELLGFSRLAEHTRDAMWRSDVPVEVMGTLAALWANVDRLAEDLLIWTTAEFGFVELADRHARISVIMPHKKNPYSLAYVRGAARELLGLWVSVAAQQATPSAQVDNRLFAYQAVPRALHTTRQALELLTEIVGALKINVERMAQRAGEDFSAATDLAEALMLQGGLHAQTAHQIVARAARQAGEAGQALDVAQVIDAAQAVTGRALPLDPAALTRSLNPLSIVMTRAAPGGAAPGPVQAMLAGFQKAAAEQESWVAMRQRRIAQAEQALIETARTLCPPT